MTAYISRRLAFLLLTLFITSLIVFVVTQYLPGDVARIVLGREAGEQQLQAFREEFGLNDPLPVQYGSWLIDFVRGDWGVSFSTRTEIFPLVMERLRNSLMLAVVTMFIGVPLALLLGVVAGLKEDSRWDNLISIGSLSVVGLPEFVTGIVLIEIFARKLGWFPANSSIAPGTTFLEALPMLILPAVAATLVLLAYVVRMTRASVVEELHRPYVRTAELKGLSKSSVVFKHVLRNALMPTVTIIAISFGWLISGLIVIENVFNYPGVGRLMVFAIDRRDLPLLQALTMVTVLGFALANLAADIIYAYLDPRIRLG
ncbi:MAG: ABC transporter permease [Candidatus Promineifilaceae bacterium]|jgi:peptide/nickel transport system permease protein